MNREELIDKLNELHTLLAKSDLSQDNYNKATSILSEIKNDLKNETTKKQTNERECI
jgi:uncharacterized protein YqgQ